MISVNIPTCRYFLPMRERSLAMIHLISPLSTQSHHFSKAGALKICPAVSVIDEKVVVQKSVFPCVCFKNRLFRRDLSGGWFAKNTKM